MTRASGCVGAAIAVLFASVAAPSAVAGNLLQAYEMALHGDPQLAGARSNLLARRESLPQTRAAIILAESDLQDANEALEIGRAHV